ncbi:hypothetical protein FD755_019012 [Muntiacus reevesi]|uniref:Uncharacterized protein n=1 Tax=Muntiacus reevesi TaxID=9886 RepID=A0A5N3X9E6_MUNRE|nr:hypothetical protein FD755_019012 [Muntiacus reevesi]
MAGLWNGHRSFTRATFTASTRAGFQKSHRKNHLGFVEGIWREWEEARGHASCHFNSCSLGATNCVRPLYMLKSRGPGDVSLEDPPLSEPSTPGPDGHGWAPAAPEGSDVDMQPTEAGGLEARGQMARLPGPPEDTGMMEEDRESPEAGRPQGRVRGSRPPPRLGTERDRGPKLTLSKRKLELLHAEPEKSKRKKQYVA